jgi:hypothetical protein
MVIAPPSRVPHLRDQSPTAVQSTEARMILIAGADPESIEAVAAPLFHAGHVPVVGAWFADPLVALWGFDPSADETADHVIDPLTERLLPRCDAILRVGGASEKADAMVGIGRARGLRVFFSLKDALDG